MYNKKISFLNNSFFIFTLYKAYSWLWMLIALNLQACMHFIQPIHSLALYISTCSWIRVFKINKNDLSITLFGHTSMHFQQALQAYVSNWTNAVYVFLFLRSVEFIFLFLFWWCEKCAIPECPKYMFTTMKLVLWQ